MSDAVWLSLLWLAALVLWLYGADAWRWTMALFCGVAMRTKGTRR